MTNPSSGRIGLFLAATAAILGGCASTLQQPVDLAPSTLITGRVGVAMTKMPTPDTLIFGADCLLCMGAAAVANSSLTSHTQKLPTEDLEGLKKEVAELIHKKGGDASVIAEDLNVDALPDYPTRGPNIAAKDFSGFQKKYNVERLLVIQITAVGMWRTYTAYIPTSDPKAMLRGQGYLVNLKNNTYDWYMRLFITRSAEGAWDEPPDFPGLTNAYFQSLELAKDGVLRALNVDPNVPAQAGR